MNANWKLKKKAVTLKKIVHDFYKKSFLENSDPPILKSVHTY